MTTDEHPPLVAGWSSRVEDVFIPVWTTVIGGPAEVADPGQWRFGAYTEVIDLTIETARKLRERMASTVHPSRRTELLGERGGYECYRAVRSGYLFLVRGGPNAYLVAYFASRPPDDVTEDQVIADLVRLADYAGSEV